MDINFELYKMFYYVSKNESFSKAAELLYISQPAVSQSIHKLEEQLNGKLFYRLPRGIRLTEEGKNLLNYIEGSIETIINAEKKFSQYIDLYEGNIRIKSGTVLNRTFLNAPLSKFIKDYQNIKIELTNGITSESIEELKNGKADMVILNLPYINDCENISIIECKQITSSFYSSKTYYDKYIKSNIKDKVLTLKELSKYSLILPAKDSNTTLGIKDLLGTTNTNLIANYVCSSTNAIADFIKLDFGIGYTNKEILKDDIDKGNVVEIKVKEKLPNRTVGIAIANNNIASSATLKLAEYIKKHYEN